jgi:CRP/FNR family transcriptional regulator
VPIEIANPVELLRNVPLFSACTDAEIRVLLKIAQRRSIPAGTAVVEEGADDDRFFAISAGGVRVTRGQRELATFGPGGFFGEVAMLDPGPRTATVTATEDLLAYAIDGQAFRGLLLEAPDISANLLRGLARRLREVDAALND